MSAKLMILLPIGLLLVLGGCNLFIDPSAAGTVNSSDITAFQKVFMSSYVAERGGKAGGARALAPFGAVISSGNARATVPVGLLTNISFISPSPTTFVNYPEPGQTTSFTITTRDAASNVYDITATTVYSAGDTRKNYVEEYYVRDIGKNGSGYFDTATPDHQWTFDDPIVTWTGAAWVQDQKARVKQVLTFMDGTTRAETIVSQTDFSASTPAPKFAAFDVNGSLDFGQFFYPTSDTGAAFSSVVVYSVTPGTSSNFWFWQGSQSQSILGIRYYTEHNQGGQSYSDTILFEKTLNTLSTQGVSTPLVWQTVFVGSQFDALAESVLRQRAIYNLDGNGNRILSSGTMTTNMQTRVVNITGQKDFFLQQLNTDYVSLSSWDTTTIYTPTGGAAEVLAGDPSKFLNTRSWSAANGQPLAVPTASLSGSGDVAGLYTSLLNGAVSANTGTTIPGAIPSATSDLQFDGTAKGSVVTHTAAFDLSTTGTIEAWVYVKQHTDTGGIVHKGVQADFLDECYSLQFWGNNGQVAFVIDGTGGGNNYDLVTSSINLNTGAWYYLAATWDNQPAASPKYMRLYINGVLRGSKVPAVSTAAQVNGSDVLIGSQLPNLYSAPYGYFSFNGAINGVVLTPSALSATTIVNNYNAYKNLTAAWPHP